MSEQPNGNAPTPGQADGEEPDFSSAFTDRVADPAGQGEKPDDAQAPSHNEPAPVAGSDSAPAQAATPDTSGTPAPQASDPWAGMTPEQKVYFERLQVSERSNRGRVGALQKQINQFQRTAPVAAPQAGSETKPDGQATDRTARLAQVAEEYGDVNGPVVEELLALREEIGSIRASTTRYEAEQDAAVLAEAYGILETTHPDWEQVRDNPKFHEWYAGQPSNIQALAGSFDPRETSLALSLWKTESGIAAPAGGSSGGATGSTATGDRRQRQLDANRQVPTGGAPAATGVPNDFNSAFKTRASQPRV